MLQKSYRVVKQFQILEQKSLLSSLFNHNQKIDILRYIIFQMKFLTKNIFSSGNNAFVIAILFRDQVRCGPRGGELACCGKSTVPQLLLYASVKVGGKQKSHLLRKSQRLCIARAAVRLFRCSLFFLTVRSRFCPTSVVRRAEVFQRRRPFSPYLQT